MFVVGLKPYMFVVGLKPSMFVVGLKPYMFVVGLKPSMFVVGLKPSMFVVGLKPKSRQLDSFSPALVTPNCAPLPQRPCPHPTLTIVAQTDCTGFEANFTGSPGQRARLRRVGWEADDQL